MQKYQLVYGNTVEMNQMITQQVLNPLNSSQASITDNTNNARIANITIVASLKY